MSCCAEARWYKKNVAKLCAMWSVKTAPKEGAFEIRRTEDIQDGHREAISVLVKLSKGYKGGDQ